jgi:hypothetical protein
MGMTSYNGIIRLGADDFGLHLSVVFPFRVGHEPLAIPWSAIRVSRTKALFTEYVRFSIDHVVLDVREKAVERLGRKQMLPSQLRL